MESLVFSVYSIMSSANNDSFTFFFLFFFFQFGCFLFLLIVWLQWLVLPVLCQIGVVRVGIPVLFLFLGKMVLVFAHWVWCWLWVFHIWLLLYWGMILLFPPCWEFLSRKGVGFCQMLFQHQMIWLCDFYISICLCDVSRLLICKYCTSLAFLE